MMGAMKAKLEPRKIGTWRRVQSWNNRVPTPAPSRAMEGFSPVSRGTRTMAPKATNKICSPATLCLTRENMDVLNFLITDRDI